MTQKELEDLILYHQHLYYSGTPEIEDWEFDQMWDELAAKYPNSELLKKVGDEGEIDADKCEHLIHMGSQEKITSEEQLKDWIRLKKIRFPVIAQLKYDGLSVELVYDKNGDFSRAVTRGNGKIGKIITDNAAKMNGVPKHINVNLFIAEQDEYAIRGEIMLPLSNVDKLVNVDEVTNVRNMASGIANQKNSSDNLNLLDVVCYDVNDTAVEYEIAKVQILRECGFITPQYNKTCLTMSEILSFIEQIRTERKTLNYQTDGVVLKQNEIPKDGDFSKARPDWQRAFKYPVDKVKTFLTDIEWSRNGYNFTPVAILEPVIISDTKVSRASLANWGEVKKLNIGIPCEVEVAKQNEIIPKVHRVVHYADPYETPKPISICPICGEPLDVSDTAIKCVNEACITHREHRIYKWIDTVGTLGFGESMLRYLIFDCHMESIRDFYCNDNIAYAIEHTNQKKNIQKAFADLWARSRNLNLWDFVAGFDLDGIGSRVIKLIVDKGYDTLEKLRKVNYDELVNIQGIGEFRATTFVEKMAYLADEMDAVLATNRVSIKLSDAPKETKSMTFCITGTLSRPRKEIEQLIISKGHAMASSVTKKVDYLVTDNPDSGSSKNEKAKTLGIPVINEETFLRIVNG